ncbi:arylsulfatase [Tautonia plasticadhaerens]|uniref:Arylsulfatase n=1 Tax=Tautonia plasticadhaerens TaxID=2527974 RepID=A0A518H328_9BACT|nr:arylsulfatase [Tautonia plasticadhaerens]QDV35242.1 Arylsulfatase [Tautonia plasticadhaerens]
MNTRDEARGGRGRPRPGIPALLLAMSLAPTAAPADEPSRPNIVVIMADDLGYSDLGCYGGEIETPNLDRLAADGLRFSQFTNTARCCPTRASLLTGLYSHQAGIGHMVGDYGIPSYQGYLNDRCVTIAEALRPAGYATLMAGKWHVGSARGRWPLDRGFDRYFGTPTGGGVYFKETLQIRTEVFFVEDDRRVEFPEDGYVTDLFTDHAIRFARDAASTGRPFFLYLAHIAPHWPLQALPEDIEKYEGRYDLGWDAVRDARYRRQLEMGLIDPRWPLSPRDPEAKPWDEMPEDARADLAYRQAVYAAQVDRIDQSVGRLVSALGDSGVLEDTLILFLSDNGCSAEGGPGGFSRGIEGAPIGTGSSYASVGLEWANASDTPFRKFKISVHEGGIASPLIAHWPAGIARTGEIDHQPGHVIDLMPTCLDLAGAEYPAERSGLPTIPLEGRSLAPAFSGAPIDREALFWEHQGNRAVRVGDWKLVASKGQPWELYDLEADRTELVDLAAERPDTVAELSGRWEAWADRCGVEPWPVRRR